MNNLLVQINKKIQDNKYIIGFIIIAIVLFLLVVVEMGRLSNKVGDSNQIAISESVSTDNSTASMRNNIKTMVQENKINSYDDVANNTSSGVMRIETFILLCNQGNYKVAYEMISDECKTLLYPSMQTFVDNYYNPIFDCKRVYEILDFKASTYKVNYYVDAITTGTSDIKGKTDYITTTGDGKINISGFIGTQNLNIKSNGEYFDVVVKKRDTYADYEEYTVSIKNNTPADIYINNYKNSNIYLINSKNMKFDLDNSQSSDFDYLVYGNSEEEFKLRFKMKYQVGRYVSQDENVDITELCFGNIKIVNQAYYDKSSTIVNIMTGKKEYVKKYTNYPENIKYSVKFSTK